MKRAIYIVVLISALLALGCSRDEVPESPKEKVRVVLSGSMDHGTAQSRADGMINPVDDSGLPPEQLEIGIVTIEYNSSVDPTVAQWGDPSYDPYLDRGFFGGNVPGNSPSGMGVNWNGNIEYTNRDGDALQTVFYDEMGVFYYLVAFYPYQAVHDLAHVEEDDGESMILDKVERGAMVIFNVNGSQDIMSTQLGKGNIEPENRLIDPLVFKHRLTCLQCDFFAESSVAAGLYGDIVSVELVEQPDKLGLNIGIGADDVHDPIFDVDIGVDVSYIGYPAVRPWVSDGVREEDPLPLPATYVEGDAVEFGYILAKSARKYKFKIVTSERGEINPLYVTYDFDPNDTGILPKPGYIYHLTFKMLESAEITLIAGPVTERWIDQRFD